MVNSFLLFLFVGIAGMCQGASSTNSNSIVIARQQNVEVTSELDSTVLSLISSAQIIGAILGSFSCSFLIDKAGYKAILICAGIFGAITTAICIIKTHWALYFVMRLLNGIPAAMISASASPFASQLATVRQRSFIGVAFQIFATFSQFYQAVFTSAISFGGAQNYWVLLFVTILLFSALSVVTFFLPDPKFCAKKRANKVEEGEKEQVQTVSWKELFTNKKYRKCLILGAFYPFGQQFSGINAVITYATVTFTSFFEDQKIKGADITPDQSSTFGNIIIAGVNFLTTLISIPLVSRFGRKPLTIIGFMIINVNLVALVVIYAISNTSPQKVVLMVCSIIYIAGLEMGPGPLLFVCLSESFPEEIRGRCLGYAFTLFQIAFLLVVLTFPYFSEVIFAAYLVYLILTVISTIMLWIYMVETKGKTMEEIQEHITSEHKRANINRNDLAATE